MYILIAVCIILEYNEWEYNTNGYKSIAPSPSNILYKIPRAAPAYLSWATALVKNHPLYNAGVISGAHPMWRRFCTDNDFKMNEFNRYGLSQESSHIRCTLNMIVALQFCIMLLYTAGVQFNYE